MMQNTEHTAAPLLVRGAGFMTPFTRNHSRLTYCWKTAALLPWGMN